MNEPLRAFVRDIATSAFGGLNVAEEIIADLKEAHMASRTDRSTKTAPAREDEKQHKADAALLEKLCKLADDPAVVLEPKEQKFLDGVCARVFGQEMTEGQRRYAEKLLEEIKP